MEFLAYFFPMPSRFDYPTHVVLTKTTAGEGTETASAEFLMRLA
ncbi:hypothetical protein [Microcoleus sp. FACHB-68]|nr:hypothetical protein [Microcoleus sp. FACHB-68]